MQLLPPSSHQVRIPFGYLLYCALDVINRRELGRASRVVAVLVEVISQIATHVISKLIIPLQKTDKSKANYGYVAKCIGTVVRSHTSLAAGTIAKFSKALKVRVLVYFY
jgi:hypothetical protein